MKKRLYAAICIVMLIALLSVAFLGYHNSNSNSKESNSKSNTQEIKKELLAQITIPLDDIPLAEDKNIGISESYFHVSGNEEKIYIGVFSYEELSYEEIGEADFSSQLEQQIIDWQDSDEEIQVVQISTQTQGLIIYEVCKENGVYGAPKMLECNDYIIEQVCWDDEQLYFLGYENEGADSNGESLSSDINWSDDGWTVAEDSNEKSLYSAQIANGSITDVKKIELEENISIAGCVAMCNGKVMFEGISEGSSEMGQIYLGTIKNNVLMDISEMKGFSEEEIITNARFVDGGERILTDIMTCSTDLLDSAWAIESGYELADISENEVINRREQDFWRYFSEDKEYDFDANWKENVFYYLEKDYMMQNDAPNYNIYKVTYDDTIQVIFGDSGDDKDRASVLDNDEQPENETKEYHEGDYSYDEYDKGNFELQLRNKADKSLKSGVYYEIFVRAFADSDGDGIGDFNGVTEKLDYLKELGVEGIWLMPINASPSYHGYDVTDYMTLNSDYGTEEDFKRLLDEAHKRDIKVIMDFVINHTSSEHAWFKDAISDENSEYRNYYRWVAENDTKDFSKNDKSNWGSLVWQKVGDSYYYAMFGSDMPDLNYNNPSVREEIKKAAGKWLELGVDGFRLDAAMHIYGSNEFKQEENPTESTIQWWNEFALYCESINPNVYLVGEAWNDNEILEEYVQPFDTKFNFTFEQEMLAAIKNGTAVTEEKKNLADLLGEILEKYSSVDTNYLDGIFGSNHDQNRIMSQLESKEKAKLAANIYLTLPGNPFIYYGEELGMYGQKPDEMIRTPFKWSSSSGDNFNTSWVRDSQNKNTPSLEEQMQDEASMYNFYKKLIQLRKSNSALINGDYKAEALENDNIMAYTREDSEQKLLVVHNISEATQTVDLSKYHLETVIYSCNSDKLESGEAVDLKNGKLELEGNASVVFEMKQD